MCGANTTISTDQFSTIYHMQSCKVHSFAYALWSLWAERIWETTEAGVTNQIHKLHQ